MKITVLGSGTSDGVPLVGCDCRVCKSRDAHDKRTRASVMVEKGETRLLIDVSIDFREQMLRHAVKRADAIFITHPHSDHISGMDDIRQFNRAIGGTMPIYTNMFCIEEIKKRFGYFFNPLQRGGGIPDITLHELNKKKRILGFDVTPLPVRHGILEILGFRIDDFAYITDASFIPESTMKLLRGVRVLILNALRYRVHATHFSIKQAVVIAERVGAARTLFTHLTHEVSHKKLCRELPKGMAPAYDGLCITL